jgi:hypothetical protein
MGHYDDDDDDEAVVKWINDEGKIIALCVIVIVK